MSTVAYLRISTDKQDISNQRLEILDYCNKNNFTVDKFYEVEVSSRRSEKERRIHEMVELLKPGDTLIVSELSRLGRSTGEVIMLINKLVEKKVNIICIKQGLRMNGKADMQSKVMVTMFSLFSELERDLISERTKQALKAKKAAGIKLGRPKGSLSKSKLDGKEEFIRSELKFKVSKSAIARKLGVSRTTFLKFIESRNVLTGGN